MKAAKEYIAELDSNRQGKQTTLTVVPRSEPRSVPQWYADIATAEARFETLRLDVMQIIPKQYEMGKIIHWLHGQFPHGHWGGFLKQFCQRHWFSPRSAFDYEQSYPQIEAAGGDEVLKAAISEGLNKKALKEFVRQVLAVAERLPAGELLKLANSAKMHKN